MARSIDSIKSAPQPPKPGRPTFESAQAIPQRIVSAATELFVELGFEGASMDLIARRANVSKRTLYDRFQSKEDVFLAAVESSSRRKVAELETFRLRSRTLRTSLEEISKKLISSIVDPEFIAFENIVAAEARRFPDLAEERSRKGMQRLAFMIAAVLKKYPPFESMEAAAVELNARIFLAMAVLPALREAMFSGSSVADAAPDFISQSVSIFIRGTMVRDADKAQDQDNERMGAREGKPGGPASPRKQPDGVERRKSASGRQSTKDRILRAAMYRFAHASYDDTGLRDIAADAGVDAAYVHRSFGSKEALFVEALETAVGGDRMAAFTSSADLPRAIAGLFSQGRHLDDKAVQPLDIMVRSLGSPAASTVLKRKILADLVTPLAAGLLKPSDTRAAMIVAVVMGIGIATTVLQLPGLAHENETVEVLLRKVIEAIAGAGLA